MIRVDRRAERQTYIRTTDIRTVAGTFHNYSTAFSTVEYNFVKQSDEYLRNIGREIYRLRKIGSPILVCTLCQFHNFITNLPMFMSKNMRLF
jgi:hypothetical protein